MVGGGDGDDSHLNPSPMVTLSLISPYRALWDPAAPLAPLAHL